MSLWRSSCGGAQQLQAAEAARLPLQEQNIGLQKQLAIAEGEITRLQKALEGIEPAGKGKKGG